MKVKERNSNFELMRIISMFFIVLWHMYIFGGIRDRGVVANPSIKVAFDFLSFLLIVHVNSFVLLTGYFSWNKEVKLKKILTIISQSLFYKILIIIIFAALGVFTFTKIDIIRNIFPLELNYNDAYWFVRYYIYLYALIPFINIIINNISKKDFKKMLIVLLILFSFIPFITGTKAFENNGYTLYQFILMYIIGSYLGKHKTLKLLKRVPVNLYRLILIIIMITCAIFNYCIFNTSLILQSYNSVYNEIFGNITMTHKIYSNPLVIIQSVSYFLLFETFSFKSKFINRISKLTLGIYLIHNNYYMRQVLYQYLKIDGGPYYSYKYVLYFFAIGILIFVTCAIIEWLRQVIFKFLGNRKIMKKLKERFNNYIDSFKIQEKKIK